MDKQTRLIFLLQLTEILVLTKDVLHMVQADVTNNIRCSCLKLYVCRRGGPEIRPLHRDLQ
jgi:hypothetical protein